MGRREVVAQVAVVLHRTAVLPRCALLLLRELLAAAALELLTFGSVGTGDTETCCGYRQKPGGHSPRNAGGRRSRNAARPSRRSALAHARLNALVTAGSLPT